MTRNYFIVIFQVRVAALQCLVKIMSLYYTYMEHYMGPALFAVSYCRIKWDFCSVLATDFNNKKILSLEILKILYQMTAILEWFCIQITMEAMKSDVDEIALQGIEFWSTVCDEEVDLAIELSEVLRFNIFLFFSIMMFHLIARTCSKFD